MSTNASGSRRHSRTGARGARAADHTARRVTTDRGTGGEAYTGFSLGELARRFSCILHGDSGVIEYVGNRGQWGPASALEQMLSKEIPVRTRLLLDQGVLDPMA